MYYVYIVMCVDNTYYTGITNDIEKRLHNHNHAKTGAKYTKTRRPVKLMYKEACKNRSLAQKREAEIKKLSKLQKIKMIKLQPGV
ncbi:MAG: GIY-YIG nuclease family protein [Erysipelotrichaceae bacterium]